MLPLLAEDRLIGTRIEKCVVERLIGRGGYGLTYLAFDEELQEHRVVKVSNAWAEDEAGKRRQEKSFIEEGLILSRLKHPQIVTLRAQGERHGHRYMVLDYIQGFSLKSALDIVSARRAELDCRWEDLLDPATAAALVLSSLQPLEYAHRANVHLPDREIFGVAHRDISPGNLILGVKGNEKGKVILIDFGTAKTDLSDTTTVNQHLVGTVPYMSKARLQKAAADSKDAEHQDFWRNYRETQNDIHALGVLFFQLLTGRLPFSGETTPQIIVRVLDPEAYSSIHREAAMAFPALSSVLRKCLVFFDFSLPPSEQPYQFPDAGAMRHELEEVFAFLSPGRSVQEVLMAFAGRLEEPSKFPTPGARQATYTGKPSALHAESAEFVIPNAPGPYLPHGILAPPRSRRFPLAALTALGAGAGACLLIAVLLWSRKDNAGAADRPGIRASASLESLDAVKAAGSMDPAASMAVEKPGRKGPAAKKGEAPARDAVAGLDLEASGKKTMAPEKPEGKTYSALPTAAETAAQAAKEGAGQDLMDGITASAWGKEAFVQVQTMVREEQPTAYDRIWAWLEKVPDSPDLLLLRSQLTLKRNPTSSEARQTLNALQTVQPAFMHPQVFRENALYLLWQADVAIYEAQKTPAARINLMKSANAYLSEFQPNAAYSAKVQGIRERLPK